MLVEVQMLDEVQMRYYSTDHVMITLLPFNAKTRSSATTTARERQRTYRDAIFELRAIIDNISRFIKFYDIKRTDSDDVRDACCGRSFLMFELAE